MAPWQGPRHRSWASDTVLAWVGFSVVLAIYCVWEALDEAPTGILTLLGVAGGAVFGAVSGDKKKRDDEVVEKVDRLERVAQADGHTMRGLDPNDAEPDDPLTDPDTDPVGGGRRA